MSYIESNLLTDEKLVYCVTPHWVIFSSGAGMILLALIAAFYPSSILSLQIIDEFTLREIAFILFALTGIYWLVQAYIYFVTSEYGVTNKRVLIKTGWIERNSLELLLDKVEGVLVDQSLLGRVLNYGSISVIGTGGTKDTFPFIPDPLLFRRMAQEQIALFERELRS